MPAPGRGTAVLHIGYVNDEPAWDTVAVFVNGQQYVLPFVNTVTYGSCSANRCWVLFAGRTGLVLGMTP